MVFLCTQCSTLLGKLFLHKIEVFRVGHSLFCCSKEHQPIPSRSIPVFHTRFCSRSFAPHCWAHNILSNITFTICHHSSEQSRKRIRNSPPTLCSRQSSLGQVCHVEPASFAPSVWGLFWLWHSLYSVEAVLCKLPCLKSLFMASWLFSFVLFPCFRRPSTSLQLTRLRRDLQGNCCFFIFLCITPTPSPILSPAALLVVIQRSVTLLVKCGVVL